MSGAIQTVDVEAHLESPDGNIPFPEGLNVVDAEVRRVFGGAGSQAEVTVIFEDLLDVGDQVALNKLVDQGVIDRSNKELLPGDVDLNSHFSGLGPEARRDEELTLTVDIEVTNMRQHSFGQFGKRIFTGTVIKVEQDDKRTVTFHAIDRRHDLNRYMVVLDTTEEPQPTSDIIHNVLGESSQYGKGLSLERGEDYTINIRGEEVNIKGTWGIDGHATVWEVLLDVTRAQGLTMYIDGENTLHITDWPEYKRYTSYGNNQLAPILNWEGGGEQQGTDVIVESPYDETGLGMYAPVSGEPNTSRIEENEDGERKEIGDRIVENNVYTRRALENVKKWEEISSSLMRDSGKVTVLGDPRINPYDKVTLDKYAIDGMSPISMGTYTVKRVYHKISSQEGFVTELHLGVDTEELFEKFAGIEAVDSATNVTTEEAEAETADEEDENEDETPWYDQSGSSSASSTPLTSDNSSDGGDDDGIVENIIEGGHDFFDSLT